MGAPRIQADYDGLREIAQTFTRNADGLNTMNQRLSHMVNNEIRGKGWIGRGADQFIREMETLIFPALSRLLGALNEAASATQKIAQTFERAEQEGGALFQGGESFNQIADNVISNLMGQNSTFNSIAQGIINSLGGGAGTSGGLVDKIIRGTGGMNTDFNGLVDNMIARINQLFAGGNQPSFSDLANTIIDNLRKNTSGGIFNDIANSIISNLRGSKGVGEGIFNQIADEMIRAMGGGSGAGAEGSGAGTGGGSGGSGTGGGGSGSGTGSGGGGLGAGSGSGGGGSGGGGGGSSTPTGTGLSGIGTTGALSEALGRLEKMDQLRSAIRDAVAKISGMSPAELGASLGGILAGRAGMAIGGAIGSAIDAAANAAQAASSGEALDTL